jgi:hypothetical protein
MKFSRPQSIPSTPVLDEGHTASPVCAVVGFIARRPKCAHVVTGDIHTSTAKSQITVPRDGKCRDFPLNWSVSDTGEKTQCFCAVSVQSE